MRSEGQFIVTHQLLRSSWKLPAIIRLVKSWMLARACLSLFETMAIEVGILLVPISGLWAQRLFVAILPSVGKFILLGISQMEALLACKSADFNLNRVIPLNTDLGFLQWTSGGLKITDLLQAMIRAWTQTFSGALRIAADFLLM